MDAVVLAAGEGRRLRPITERWPKPLLPIDGRPVVATLLHEIRAAGFEEAWIVVGHLGGAVRRLLGDGEAFRIRLRYATQPRADGSADAVRHALAAGARPPLLVTAADTVYRAGDLAAARAAWQGRGSTAGLGVRALPGAELRHRTRVQVEDGRVLGLGGTGDAVGGGELTAAPLWFLSDALVERLDALAGPPYELAEAALAAIRAGEEVTALPVGPTRDLTSPGDVVSRNFAYLLDTGQTP